MADSQELIKYIDQIISATEKGSMVWEKANPTTYVWVTSGPPQARIVIQRIVKNELEMNSFKRKNYFVLQAFDSYERLKISISGYDFKQVNSNLGTLFEAVATANLNKGLDFLKNVVPSK